MCPQGLRAPPALNLSFRVKLLWAAACLPGDSEVLSAWLGLGLSIQAVGLPQPSGHGHWHIAFRSQSPGEVAPSGLGCGGQTHSVGTISQMPASALPLGCLGLKEIQEPLVNLCTRL